MEWVGAKDTGNYILVKYRLGALTAAHAGQEPRWGSKLRDRTETSGASVKGVWEVGDS